MADGFFPTGQPSQPVFGARDIAHKPRADKTSTGDRGQEIYVTKQVELLQALQYAKIEGGAADATAGEGQTDEDVRLSSTLDPFHPAVSAIPDRRGAAGGWTALLRPRGIMMIPAAPLQVDFLQFFIEDFAPFRGGLLLRSALDFLCRRKEIGLVIFAFLLLAQFDSVLHQVAHEVEDGAQDFLRLS